MKTIKIIAVWVLIASPLFAQKIDINLVDVEVYPRVKVYLNVFDAAGKVNCNVDPNSFRLKEYGQPRNLRVLSGKATETSIGILLDDSGSMGGFIENVRGAAQRFVDVLGGTDRACTYAFDDNSYRLHAMIDVAVGTNKRALRKSLDAYGTHGGGTNMYGGIDDLIRQDLAAEKDRRRAIVALTDGVSGGLVQTAIDNAKKNRVAVYTIGMGDIDVTALSELARATGGKFYKLSAHPTVQELTNVYVDIKQRLDCQYTLIYETPITCPDGSTVPIEVSAIGISQRGTYKRPINFPQMDFNIFYTAKLSQVTFEPPYPVECEEITFSTRIQATSCSDSLVLKNVVIRAYDIRPGARTEVAKSDPIELQSNGVAKRAVIEWNTTGGFRGERTLEFVIDPGDEVLEKSKEDNLARTRIRFSEVIHDLFIASIDYSPKPAAPCDVVKVTVKVDDGTKCKGMTLPDIEIEMRDGGRPLNRGSTAIKVGEPQAVTFEWEAKGITGPKPLTFVIDPDGRFGREQSKKNNLKQALIEVKPVQHELSPQSATHEPKRVIVGDTVNFKVVVADNGRCPGSPLSQNTLLRVSDANSRVMLAQSRPFSIKTQSTAVVPLKWPTRLNDHGSRSLLLIVDPSGIVAEQAPPGKDNNSLDYSIEVLPMPHDLVIESATITPLTPADGDPAVLRVVVADKARFPGVTLEGVTLKAFERLNKAQLGKSQPTAIISQQKATIDLPIDTGGFAGKKDILIVVDPDNRIKELTPQGLDGENNNQFVLRVTIL